MNTNKTTPQTNRFNYLQEPATPSRWEALNQLAAHYELSMNIALLADKIFFVHPIACNTPQLAELLKRCTMARDVAFDLYSFYGFARGFESFIPGFKASSTSPIKKISKACAQTSTTPGIAKVIQNREIVDLAKATTLLGKRYPIFLFVLDSRFATSLTWIGLTGRVIAVGIGAIETYAALTAWRAATGENTEEKRQKLQGSALDLLSNGLYLTISAVPLLLFPLTPQTIAIMSIAARSIGIYKSFNGNVKTAKTPASAATVPQPAPLQRRRRRGTSRFCIE